MGVRGTKPRENLAARAVELTPLSVVAPKLKGGKEAEAEYVRLAKELAKLGHLSDLNRQCLVNYCEAFAMAQDALDEVSGEGVTLENMGTGGKYMHPALAVWSMAVGRMEKEAKNLGMTPMSLQSIKNVKTPGKKDDAPQGSKPSHYLGRPKAGD